MQETKKRQDKNFLDLLTETLIGEREALNEPTQEVEPGEQVIGTLTDERVRALYSLRILIEKKIQRFRDSLPTEKPTDENVLKFKIERVRLASEQDSANKLFWQGIYETFPMTLDPRVGAGIRKGWNVVIFKNTSHSLEEILGSLLS